MPGTVVWISGASSGIGAALAAAVPFADAEIVNLSRSPGPPGTLHVPVDLTERAAWDVVEDDFAARLSDGQVGRAIFVHCAGTLEPIGFAGEVASPEYQRNVVLNAAAPLALGHAFLRAVRSWQGRSDLWLLSSGAATRPYPGWSSYGAAKAAVDHWVRTVGEEQRLRGAEGRPGCRVLSVAPGVVATAMQERIRETDPAAFPAVGKFVDLHERGELRDPALVARQLWSLTDGDLQTGTVVDLRTLT